VEVHARPLRVLAQLPLLQQPQVEVDDLCAEGAASPRPALRHAAGTARARAVVWRHTPRRSATGHRACTQSLRA
jgi:hypothetical protein